MDPEFTQKVGLVQKWSHNNTHTISSFRQLKDCRAILSPHLNQPDAAPAVKGTAAYDRDSDREVELPKVWTERHQSCWHP